MNIHPRTRNRASVLLLMLFLMAITMPLLAMLCHAQVTQTRCVHNDISGKTALYVAEAGINRAIAELVQDSAWRAGFAAETFPADLTHTFTVTVADVSGNVQITSTGDTADGYSKTITVTLNGF